MRRFIRACEPAPEVVREWGYPRELSAHEVEHGLWYTNGDGLAWLIPPLPEGTAIPESAASFGLERSLSLHARARPGAGRPLLTQRSELAIQVLAEVQGAERLRVLLPGAALARYLSWRGWQQDELGCYRELGE